MYKLFLLGHLYFTSIFYWNLFYCADGWKFFLIICINSSFHTSFCFIAYFPHCTKPSVINRHLMLIMKMTPIYIVYNYDSGHLLFSVFTESYTVLCIWFILFVLIKYSMWNCKSYFPELHDNLYITHTCHILMP